jgi:hypothetical protein
MPAGRPEFIVDEALCKKVETLAAQGLAEYQICAVIGCSQETFIKKKKKYSELVEAIKEGQAKGVATITNSLFNKAKGGDNVSMIFYLCNRDSENWRRGDKPEENGGENDIPIQRVQIEVISANS